MRLIGLLFVLLMAQQSWAQCKLDLADVRNPGGFVTRLQLGQPREEVESLLGADYDLRDVSGHTVVLSPRREVLGILTFRDGGLATIQRTVQGLDCGDRFQFMRQLAALTAAYGERFNRAPALHASASTISLVFSELVRVEIALVELPAQIPPPAPRLSISVTEKYGL